MILDICSEPKVLEVMRIVNIFITIIKIVVPILLIFTLMLKFAKAVINDDKDNLQSAMKSAPKNIIAAVVILLAPSLVAIIVRITFPENDYENCITIRTAAEIQKIYVDREANLISKAEKALDDGDSDAAYSHYINAVNYLDNIKDEDVRKVYEEKLKAIKEKIDELNEPVNLEYVSTGLGRDIVANEKLIVGCRWVMNQSLVNIRLATCVEEEYKYTNPEADLPGGAILRSNGQYYAKETIPLSTYQMGVFFGEEHVTAAPQARYAFMTIYRTEFINTTVNYAIRANRDPLSGAEIYFRAGNCAQNYRNSKKVARYDSGKYKAEIDDTVENTKYFLIADDAGKDMGQTTNVIYHSYTGIEQQIEQAGKDGIDFVQIIENVIKTGNDDSYRYKNARVYDCRNLVEDGTITVIGYTPPKKGNNNNNNNSNAGTGTTTKVDRNIIYLGDSRTHAYIKKKSILGLDETKEFVIAKVGTKLDDDFRSQLSDASYKMNKYNTVPYAVTVNYGVNSLKRYEGFCNYYVDFVHNMDAKNDFYIISVNPTDTKRMTSGSASHTNEQIETFNDYMKNTCVGRIKEKSPDHNVYYCDIYNTLTNQQWIDKGYIKDDGLHYTEEGYKYIYNQTKACIAQHS